MGPGDFESLFIKAGDSESKEGLKIEEARGERMSEKNGALETASRGQPKRSGCCPMPVALWLPVAVGFLTVREIKQQRYKVWAHSSKSAPCVLCLRLFKIFFNFIVVQVQLPAFSPHHSPPTPAIPTSLP